LKLKLKEEA
jgi:hypothetical protein